MSTFSHHSELDSIQLLQSFRIKVAVWDKDAKFLGASQGWHRIFQSYGVFEPTFSEWIARLPDQLQQVTPGGEKQLHDLHLPDKSTTYRVIAETLEHTSRSQVFACYFEVIVSPEWSMIAGMVNLGTWDWNLSTGNVSYSEKWASILGRDASKLAGGFDTFAELTHPEDLERVKEKLERYFSGEEPVYEVTIRMKHADGNWRYIRSRGEILEKNPSGEAIRMVGIHQDVTNEYKYKHSLEISKDSLLEEVVQAQLQLQTVKDENEALVSSFPDMMFTLDKDGRFYNFRTKDVNNLSMPADQFMGKTIFDIWPPEVAEFHFRYIEPVFKTGIMTRYEYQMPNLRGEIRDFETRVVPMTGNQLVLCIVRDITTEKKVQRELQEHQQRLALALKGGDVGVWEFYPDTNKVSWNDRIHEIFGLEPGTFDGTFESYQAMIHPEDRLGNFSRVSKALEKGGDFHTRDRIIRANGETGYLEGWGKLITIDGSNQQVLLGICKDVTEEEISRQALESSRARLKIALESGKIGTWEYTFDPVACTWDEVGNQIFGYDLATNPLDLEKANASIPDDEQENIGAEWERAIEHNQSFHLEHSVVLPNGDRRSVEVYGSPVYEPDGTPQKVIGVVFDRTPIKQAQKNIIHLNKQLREKVIELEDANRGLADFTYSISHDLRAPLRHIISYGEMLQEDLEGKLSGDSGLLLDNIMTSSNRMGMLIDDLLEYARAGRLKLQPEWVDMNEVVSSTWEILMMQTKDREFEFTCHDLPRVWGDKGMIEQVMTNLISNSIKYTRPKAHAKIGLRVYAHNGEHIFHLEDNGVGFDMNHRNKLFSVFQRLHDRTEFEGTGIGLANVQRIIERHGGKIWATGKVNEGASFFFCFNTSISNLHEKEKSNRPGGG